MVFLFGEKFIMERKEILEKLYDDFLTERDSIQEKLDEYKNKFMEADSYINSITALEESDFKVFSPRNAENIYKESLEENRSIKTKYENEYQIHLRKKEVIDSRLKKLQYLIENPCKNNEILDLQENDRQRIARDLHDSSLQNLTHLIHKIELASLYIDKDTIRAKLELAAISKDLKNVIEDIRNTIFDLRPMQFDDLGFKEAVEKTIEKIKAEASLDIIYCIEDINIADKNILMTIYRIVLECICNSVKHSNAGSISVKTKVMDNTFNIDISDDGEGFEIKEIFMDKARHHFGLSIMNERVNILHGKIDFKSEKSKGTDIHIELPLSYIRGEN